LSAISPNCLLFRARAYGVMVPRTRQIQQFPRRLTLTFFNFYGPHHPYLEFPPFFTLAQGCPASRSGMRDTFSGSELAQREFRNSDDFCCLSAWPQRAECAYPNLVFVSRAHWHGSQITLDDTREMNTDLRRERRRGGGGDENCQRRVNHDSR